MRMDRDIEQVIAEIARQGPALILTGSLQVGKTNLLQRVFSQYNYVSLDVPLLAEQTEELCSQFLRDHPVTLRH
jgi:hypothetical protein